MSDLYPSIEDHYSDLIREYRREHAGEQLEFFNKFSGSVFRPGAVSGKYKQLIAVAVAHVTQCPYCIRGHTRAALKAGATRAEIMESIWVAVEMKAGSAFAHSTLAIDELINAESD